MKNMSKPAPNNEIKDFSLLPACLQEALSRLGITEPTPVQAAAIAPALQGRDVLATAQTGTGKTFAFLLPLAVKLMQHPQENALILSPTRELAQQTQAELEKLSSAEFEPKTALIIGGDNIHKQYADLRAKPRVIIATPGRLLDHMGRKSVNLKNIHTVVLDETDRMLDMGFIDDMRSIVSALLPPRQTLLFSATLPQEIQALANEFLQDPVRVQIGSVATPADLVLQEIVHVDVREKLPQLLHELKTRQGSVLIFTRTKHGAERLAKQLRLYGQKANALHGDLRQNRRRQVLEFFRNGTVRILVATDVAARGIDVPHIAHVINYDLPQSPEDYIHRIGRTGRAGAVGSALSLISDDGAKWKEICKVTRFSIPVKTIQKTIEPLPAPKFVAQEEGSAHAKNRRRVRPAKSASQEGEKAALNSAEQPRAQKQPVVASAKPEERPARSQQPVVTSKPKTFHKAVSAAAVLTQREDLPFRAVKVGVSKKKLQKEQAKSFKQPRKTFSQKHRFSKRKRR